MARLKNTKADIAGNTFGKAYNLGTFRDTSVVIDDAVGSTDRADFYRINFARRSYAAIALTGLQANVDVEIYGQNRRLISRLDNVGKKREFSAGDSPAGVFFLKVFPKDSGDTTYRLTILSIIP